MRSRNMLVLAAALVCLASAVVNAQNEIELAVTISRPRLVAIGQTNVQLICTLASFDQIQSPTNTCKFALPDSSEITVNYETGLVEGATGIQGHIDINARTCGITIATIAQAHIGQWSCIMNDAVPFQKGTFNILTEGHVRDVRLPYHVVPHNYELTIVPIIDVGNFTIPGNVKIHFNTAATIEDGNKRRVVVHSKETLIKEDTVVVTDVDGNPFANVETHEYDLEREFYVVHLDADLQPDTAYSLSLEFTSVVNNQLYGMYRSYFMEDGEQKWMAATQFQDIHARKAFPCLDEPDRKATFDVKVGRKAEHIAVSNMPVVNTEPMTDPPNYELDTFDRSPVMCSYLLAFVIADFGTTANPNDETFSIVHVKSKAAQATYAADVGLKIMEFFETYYDYPYPLPKMDMAALPDFGPGAMENWGLITYREVYLLYEEGVSSLADKERIEEIVAHELAHMWFGNLVTTKWWTDLWLNEGFASFVESIGVHAIRPENELPDRILLNDMHDVFGIDALETSLPVSVNVENPEYDMTFSRLNYGKGSCLIRMAENFLTTPTFNKGINRYLKAFEFSNAERADLWEYLDAAAKEDGTLLSPLNVHDIMEDWLAVAGYPVVKVTKGTGSQYTLAQSRFFLNPTATQVDTKWWIPVTIATPGTGPQNFTYPSEWISPEQASIDVDIASSPFIINVKQTGYYRVNYDTDNWFAIIDALKTAYASVEKLNRAQLLDDSFNLARANQLDYDVPLALAEYLVAEDQFIPLQAGLNSLVYLDRMLRHNPEDYAHLQEYVKEVFLPAYNRLGFEGEATDGYLTVLARKGLIDIMCLHQHADCSDKADALFRSWMAEEDPDTNNPIAPDLKQDIYEIAMMNGGQEEFDFLWERYQNVRVDADRNKIIYGLAASQNEALLTDYLGKTIDGSSSIRTQDCSFVYRGVGATLVGRRVQFDWLKTNYAAIKAYFGDAFAGHVSTIVSGFLDDANTNEDIAEVEAFRDAHLADITSVVPTINQGIDTADTNVQWVTDSYDEVLDWLQQRSTVEPTTSTTNAPGAASAMLPLKVLLASVALAMILF